MNWPPWAPGAAPVLRCWLIQIPICNNVLATPEPVEPIGEHRQSVVIDTTGRYIAQAGELFNRRFKPIEVLFDLKGKTAGIYRVKRGTRAIRYNPWILSKYFEHSLANTVPHEVAHYIADKMYGLARIRPHGDEWRMPRFAACS